MSINGLESYKLSSLEGDKYDPAWSPDGTKITFKYRFEDIVDIRVVNADGSSIQN